MIWNYRVFREDNGDLSVREVFYERDGKIIACSNEAVQLAGDSIEALITQIEWFREALALPILTLADVPQKSSEKRKTRDRTKNISHEQLVARLGLDAAEDSVTEGEHAS